MAFNLLLSPRAGAVYDALGETDEAPYPSLLKQVDEVFDRLEEDPGDPKLGTRHFQTHRLSHIRSTPVRGYEWSVLWRVVGEAGPTILVEWMGPTEAGGNPPIPSFDSSRHDMN